MVTGERAQIARLHPRTPIAGAKSNAKIVSFQRNMGFDSYGKVQSYNAPVSKRVAFAYTKALNYMLAKNSNQKIYVGDATTVFWAERKHEIEDVLADIFGEPPKDNPDQDYKALIAMFKSPETGTKPELDPNTKFYVLGLAPNAARIAVRFWYTGSVRDVAENIYQHFEDISIAHANYELPNCPINQLLASTAIETKDPAKTNRVYCRGKYYDVMPNLAGDFMKAILTSTPYPRTLLGAVITRTKAEQSNKDSKTGKSIQNVSYPRAALIKAILCRETRYRNSNGKEEIGMSLDIRNTNPGYLLGRLFAVLEKVQIESAGGEGKINATIRDRFYGAASSTPVAVFSHLMKLKNYHLSKPTVEKYKSFYEKLMGEITDKLSADNPFPSHLSLDDQGRFAVGYYHQRQDFFKKKSNE
jgi:CRISPR-associated protein Csd1